MEIDDGLNRLEFRLELYKRAQNVLWNLKNCVKCSIIEPDGQKTFIERIYWPLCAIVKLIVKFPTNYWGDLHFRSRDSGADYAKYDSCT